MKKKRDLHTPPPEFEAARRLREQMNASRDAAYHEELREQARARVRNQMMPSHPPPQLRFIPALGSPCEAEIKAHHLRMQKHAARFGRGAAKCREQKGLREENRRKNFLNSISQVELSMEELELLVEEELPLTHLLADVWDEGSLGQLGELPP